METISFFDIFKVGVGPSSSHTVGPWKAAGLFLQLLEQEGVVGIVEEINILLYGSLAKTGKGHGTDIALMLGLSGEDAVTIPVDQIDSIVMQIMETRSVKIGGKKQIGFNPDRNIHFLFDQTLPFHSNAVTIQALLENGKAISKTYYSVGGGFVVTENHTDNIVDDIRLPYPIEKAQDLLKYCNDTGLRISDIVFVNEQAWRRPEEIVKGVEDIYNVMSDCIYRGCNARGELPGGLNVARRAAALSQGLLKNASHSNYKEWVSAIRRSRSDFNNVLDWVSCFALAVNEENAAFGRVVTAPTNGSAGVIPAVLHYYLLFCNWDAESGIIQFLLTAAEIGSIFKKGATISAAMGGCQAEIGVSSAMAAAALTECLGGTPAQALMAAEIAMEHHLGLTCDPIGGLVQVPCIERNTMGAIKAITASQLALQSDPAKARVSLDMVIKTMWDTALDMSVKYKETADGGLAANIPLSLPEC